MAEPRFDPARIIEMLERHGVRYVMIGAFAATLHGSPVATRDADICPDPEPDNLERLARALTAMDARLRVSGEPEGVAFVRDPRTLAQAQIWTLVTDHGSLDLSFVPSGTQGYNDLVRHAVLMEVGGHSVPVASLLDVIRSKEAANRDKDRGVLPLLREMLDRTHETDG